MKTNILIILILALGFYGCNESEGSQSMDDDKIGDNEVKLSGDDSNTKMTEAEKKVYLAAQLLGEGADSSNATGEDSQESASTDEGAIAGQAFITCNNILLTYTQYSANQGPEECKQGEETSIGCHCSIDETGLNSKKTKLKFSSLTRESCQREYIKLATKFENNQGCTKSNSESKPQKLYTDSTGNTPSIYFGVSL